MFPPVAKVAFSFVGIAHERDTCGQHAAVLSACLVCTDRGVLGRGKGSSTSCSWLFKRASLQMRTLTSSAGEYYASRAVSTSGRSFLKAFFRARASLSRGCKVERRATGAAEVDPQVAFGAMWLTKVRLHSTTEQYRVALNDILEETPGRVALFWRQVLLREEMNYVVLAWPSCGVLVLCVCGPVRRGLPCYHVDACPCVLADCNVAVLFLPHHSVYMPVQGGRSRIWSRGAAHRQLVAQQFLQRCMLLVKLFQRSALPLCPPQCPSNQPSAHCDASCTSARFDGANTASLDYRFCQAGAGIHIRAVSKCTSPLYCVCLLYTSPSPRDRTRSRMPSSA